MTIADIRKLNRRRFCGGAATAVIAACATRGFGQSIRNGVIEHKLKDPSGEACHRAPRPNRRTEVVDGMSIEYDVPVKLRDGVTILTDIYRPEGSSNTPAIVAYSPYGKGPQPEAKDPPGVPHGKVSRYTKFEGPDPVYWTKQGYAVINPDARGAYWSEGNISFWGTQEGKDSADLIEWLARQPWCNGKVGMSGSSWLAVSQWFAAAERPPHLAAIAPWQGFDDFYRQSISPGGVPETGFVSMAVNNYCGQGYVDDIPAILKKYPLMNAYWEDKIAAVERITVPAYVVNTFNHFHSLGTMDAFRRMGSKDKWLRVSNSFEWPDYYQDDNVEDLRKFFDHYLKGINNGWEKTPKVRMSVTNPGGQEIVNRAETSWPLSRERFAKLHLDKDKLLPTAPSQVGEVAYDANNGEARFIATIDKRTEITGYMKLRLWVEARGHDDMDLFVYVRKLGANGDFMPALVLGQPHPGAQGWQRVSHRELDPRRSTPSEPYLTHKRLQKLQQGQIVPVDIGIWPSAMIWEPGQKLEVLVAGRFMRDKKWFEPFRYDTDNKGSHVIHTGGKYDSYLLYPVVS